MLHYVTLNYITIRHITLMQAKDVNVSSVWSSGILTCCSIRKSLMQTFWLQGKITYARINKPLKI